MDYAVVMRSQSVPRTLRLAGDVERRLVERSVESGQSAASLVQRYVDEGLRMDAHPGIVFRSSVAGRRPALAGGPEVWTVISFLHDLDAEGDEALAEAAQWFSLSPHEVRVAVGYYAEFAGEVDAWIETNREMARKAEAAWRAQQDFLAR